ncbi:hypothetical protein AB1I63_00185 [Streptococcus pneumoniae]
MKVAVCLYPACSLQEITCLTAALTLFVGAKIEYVASQKEVCKSEEGLAILQLLSFLRSIQTIMMPLS